MKELKVIASLSDISNVPQDLIESDRIAILEERLREVSKVATHAIRLLRLTQYATPKEIQETLIKLQASVDELDSVQVQGYLVSQFDLDKMKSLRNDEALFKVVSSFLLEQASFLNFQPPAHWTNV